MAWCRGGLSGCVIVESSERNEAPGPGPIGIAMWTRELRFLFHRRGDGAAAGAMAAAEVVLMAVVVVLVGDVV